MRQRRNKAQRLRTAVEVLPRHTREAMLRGIDGNRIIVGAYTHDGGICPMLAAHRNGGRANFASFALAWDDFTGAAKHPRRTTRPRRASRREIRALRSYLEMSLLSDATHGESMAELAAGIRAERRAAAERDPAAAPAAPPQPQDRGPVVVRKPPDRERFRVRDLRGRPAKNRPKRRLDIYTATAAASDEIAGQDADRPLQD